MTDPLPAPVPPTDTGALAWVVPAMRGACPRCGAPTLFAGVLRFASRCPACGLDLDQFNVGDGPAAFLTLILGTLVTAGAVFTQLAFAPPWWLQLLVWGPVTLAAVMGSLRLTKGILLTVEYRQAAREGKVAPPLATAPDAGLDSEVGPGSESTPGEATGADHRR